MRHPKKILIIDDDTDILFMTRIVLTAKGYDVLVDHSSGSVEALHKGGKKNPSLIFLDLDIDGDDGRDICKQLKEDPRTRDIPIFFISGTKDLPKETEACHADGYIEKPFGVLQLVEVVEKYAMAS